MTAASDPARPTAPDASHERADDAGSSEVHTVKDQFKDALARKQAKSASGGQRSRESGKNLGSTQSDKRQRQFRRKSGG